MAIEDTPAPAAAPSPQSLARVVAVRDETLNVRRIFVEPSMRGRHLAGQVAELGIPGARAGVFAIASGPDEPGPAVFLIKNDGKASTDLFAVSPGDALSLRAPLGPGFDLSGLASRDVLLIGVGTAIAPLRSALVTLLAARAAADPGEGPLGTLTLVHGVRRPGDVCFVDEHPRWRAAGVRIRLVASRPEAEDRWRGRVGRAQDHLRDLVTPRTTALLAGMEIMVEEVGANLTALGVEPDQVRSNAPRAAAPSLLVVEPIA